MRVIFMGTSEFAVPSLRALTKSSSHQILLVVTQVDTPQGRGLRTESPPIKKAALSLNLPVIQVERINKSVFFDLINSHRADVIFCAAYGKFLPEKMLSITPFGAVNLHPSLLPLYRGAAPVQRALMDGCNETGISFIKMVKDMDAGDILYQERMPVSPEDTSEDVLLKTSMLGAKRLPELLMSMESGSVIPVPQDHSKATYAPSIEKDEGKICWSSPAEKIFNLWRGLTLKPGVFTFLNSKRFILNSLRMSVENCIEDGVPGTLIIRRNSVFVVAGDRRLLEVVGLKPEGKKNLTAREFINGYRPEGKKFE